MVLMGPDVFLCTKEMCAKSLVRVLAAVKMNIISKLPVLAKNDDFDPQNG